MSRRINTLDEKGLPPAGVEYRLAHHFRARPDAAASRILYELVARPRRFRDLKEALRVPSDNTITVALRTLRDEGVIDQRVDAGTRPPTYWYELNGLGIEVFSLMQHFAYAEAEARRHAESSVPV